MNTITLSQALDLLQRASRFQIPGQSTEECSFNVEDEAFLHLVTSDGDDYLFNYSFTKSRNATVKVNKDKLILLSEPDESNEAGEVELLLLVPLWIDTAPFSYDTPTTNENIDDRIDDWHENRSAAGVSLPDHLGVTYDVYKIWVETQKFPS